MIGPKLYILAVACMRVIALLISCRTCRTGPTGSDAPLSEPLNWGCE